MTCPKCTGGMTIDSANVVFPWPAQGRGATANVDAWENLRPGAVHPTTGCEVGYAACESCGRLWHPLVGYAEPADAR